MSKIKSSWFWSFVFGLLPCFASAQETPLSPDILNYIEKYSEISQEEMLRSGIPASITLAQGIHESNMGKSVLATDANNHFGIKCHKEWTGSGYTYDDDAKDECFRIYKSAEESYRDHSDFLTSRPRYASLFTLDRMDYKSWAYGLKAAGYATNPKYPEILIKLIENYHLHDYDNLKNFIAKKQQATPTLNQTTANSQVKTETLEFQEKGSFNGVACIIVDSKTQPKQIADKYKISLDDLLSYNEMEEGDWFSAGDRVYFAHKKKVGDTELHTVKPGESMWQIAQQHGMKIHKLYEKNRMKMNDQPIAGEVVYLQQKHSTSPRTTSYEAYLKETKRNNNIEKELKAEQAEKANALVATNDRIYDAITSKNYFPPSDKLASDNNNEKAVLYYEVQPKETLYSIARQFSTTVQQLKTWNNLSDNGLKIGQQIIVKQ